jgi:hypothetical protein
MGDEVRDGGLTFVAESFICNDPGDRRSMRRSPKAACSR